MSDDGFTPGFILAVMLCATLFVWITGNKDESWRKQIADHGCAEFYIDQNNDRQWRWNSEKIH